ncbi:formimidoylglutamate deiminase [Mesorhizobium soli]|uniref:formimidoylglutamate deiminase n=1 Tax=Pseudaminobacter soli (ex Li et al. 2025) TaxID=1295366 RepID=UPI0024766C77|nr:formimidoylglutamate deiminase [Mesorhizobium soli]MDH6232245.1 formimidoylglutamate deiminase [Mesorhizobium soli]
MSTIYQVEHLHQQRGWLSPGYIEIGDDGIIRAVSGTKPQGKIAERLRGFGVPGLSNLHSHAFQRALAGRTEFVTTSRAEDNLWTWRKEMYRMVDRLTPEDYEAIAAQVYLEMLQFGMTAVCEFHYVHHRPDGQTYANPAEMSDRLIAAAAQTGLGLTILPVLYAHGGINKPLEETQKRFAHSVDAYLKLIDTLHSRRAANPNLRVGMALHSLRAVTPDEAQAALAGAKAIDPEARLHIHVSETTHEVAEVVAGLGARPVQWLLDNAGLGPNWCLVHATHLDASEIAGLAASGAVAGLCPLTEATMGDGFFPLVEYHEAGGAFGIGTDSHYSTSTAEELRILECGKRLELRRRNVIARPHKAHDKREVHTGRLLFEAALAGGEQASAQGSGALVVGKRGDLVMLDPDSNPLLGHGPNTALDGWILGGTQNPVRDVMVAGKWVIRDGRHPLESAVRVAYQQAMARLTN